jgi:valyl-tRNA synthetase
LWVARMVMLGLKFAGDVPFRRVFIAPLVFDERGRKMSKSLGNTIEPIDIIARYGADAFRFGIIRQMRLESQELRFDERFCEKAREFNNKMWNALRYLRSLPEGLPGGGVLPPVERLSLADKWILTELYRAIERVTKALDEFAFGVAADELVEFVWYKYCDWYLEATKTPSPTRAAVLSYVLNAAVRLLHPIAPFVTEEIWQALPHDGATIVTASWPDPSEVPVDAVAAARYETLMGVVTKAREFRVELGLAPREKLTLEVPGALDADARTLLALHANASLEDASHNGVAGDPLAAVTVRAPRALLKQRYAKDVERLDAEVARLEKKLENPQFASKASPDVVAKEREKLAGYERERERARAQLAALGAEETG